MLLERGMTPDQIRLEVGCSLETVRRRIRAIRAEDPSFEHIGEKVLRLGAGLELVEPYDPSGEVPTPEELYEEAARATMWVLRHGTAQDKITAAALVHRYVPPPAVEAPSDEHDLLRRALEASASAAQARELGAANDA